MVDQGEDFILEEDRDSGHGPTENKNPCRRYKKEIGLKYYFNASKSPDLYIAENTFLPLTQELSNTGHTDIAELNEQSEWIWDHVISKEYICHECSV